MSVKHGAPTPADRVDGVYLRSLGRLSLATWELDELRRSSAADIGGSPEWNEFAEHLADAADAVREGACRGSHAGGTIAVQRHGVLVPVDVDYLDRLAEKIDRHVRVGRALGVVDPAAFDDGTTLSA